MSGLWPRALVPSIQLMAVVALGSGCAVGPNYARPQTPITAAFRGQTRADPTSFADLPWWELFRDDKLVALIKAALTDDNDLRAAVARVEQQREIAGISTDALLPSVSIYGGPSYQRIFTGLSAAGFPRGNVQYPAYQIQAALSWEIDLWGRLRRLREAALANYLATEDARRGVVVSLISTVAQDYFQLIALDHQLAIAHRTVASRRQTLQLFRDQEEGGVGNRLQTASEEANLADAEATISNLRQQIVVTENTISILIGRAPGPIPRAREFIDRLAPPDVPLGLPATLLERRPDLRQAEANLVAANALVGAAFAQFFPQLNLSASGGFESTTLGTLLSGSAALFGVGLVVNWLVPLLNGYRIKHQWRAQQANWQALVAVYAGAVLNAMAEVSNAYAATRNLRDQRAHLEDEVRLRVETVELAKIRFTNGVASYLDVVQAEQNLFPAELSLAQIIGYQYSAMAQLYRALGGGWESPTQLQTPAPAAAQEGTSRR